MELEFLKTLVIIFGVSASVVFILHKLPEKCEMISDIETETYLISENTSAAGRSIKDLRIRSETGATVIAVRRGKEVISSPEPEFIFKPGDVVYLIGRRENVLKAIELLESSPSQPS